MGFMTQNMMDELTSGEPNYPNAAADRAKRQTKAAILAASAIAEVIRELGTVPSGHLYAQICGQMDLKSYEGIIAMLVRTGLVDRSNHLLTWTGPTKEQP